MGTLLTPDETPEFVGTRAVARRLGIHPVGASRLITSGRLPGFKVGRDWIVRTADLEAFAASYNPRPGRRWPGRTTEGGPS